MEPSIPFALFEQLQIEAEGLVQHHIRAYDTYSHQHHRRLDKQHWHRVKGDQHLCVYRRIRQHQSSDVVRLPEQLLGLGTLYSTLEDVICGLLTPTAVVMRTSQAYAGNHLLDAAVLATLVRPTTLEPLNMVSLKWWLQRTKRRRPWKHEHQDFIVLESIGICRSDYSGDRIGFRLLHSVDLPVAYSSSVLLQPTRRAAQYKRVERGQMSSCFLFRRVGAGMVDCFLRATAALTNQQLLPLRWRRSLRKATIVNEMLQICAVVLDIAETNKLMHFLQQLVVHTADQPKSSREPSAAASCEICLNDFALFASRHRCQLCPQV